MVGIGVVGVAGIDVIGVGVDAVDLGPDGVGVLLFSPTPPPAPL